MSELSCETSDEASENELLDRSLSVWRGWSAIEKEDFTPVPLDLHTACSIGQYDWVRSIIARNEGAATVDRKNKGGWTALMYACYIGHDNIVHLLVKAGCQMNKMKNPRGHTPLMLAASCGNENVARTLVRNGAELEVKDKGGWTALFHATYAGHQNFVAYLLEAGANINAVEPKTGLSPFMLAAAEGHEIIVQLFLQHGVNVHAKAYNGDMARSLALIKGYMKIVSLIDNHSMPVSRLRSEPGLDFYLSSPDEDPQTHPHPKQMRNLGKGGANRKSKGPSIRDGPEAIARMIDRTRPDDVPLCADMLTPKGYMSFSNAGSEKTGSATRLSYRDVTSPINHEDYKETSGDADDFGDDSNAFSKTGAITIKSSSSSSGGLVAALGLSSREGSLDSDDSRGYDLSHHHQMEEDSSDQIDSNSPTDTDTTNPDHQKDFDEDYENNTNLLGGESESRFGEGKGETDGKGGTDIKNLPVLKLPPTDEMMAELEIQSGVDSKNLLSSKEKPRAVVSPLREYFPLDVSFPPDGRGGNGENRERIGDGVDGATAGLAHQREQRPPRDSMSQSEIVQAYFNSMTAGGTNNGNVGTEDGASSAQRPNNDKPALSTNLSSNLQDHNQHHQQPQPQQQRHQSDQSTVQNIPQTTNQPSHTNPSPSSNRPEELFVNQSMQIPGTTFNHTNPLSIQQENASLGIRAVSDTNNSDENSNSSRNPHTSSQQSFGDVTVGSTQIMSNDGMINYHSLSHLQPTPQQQLQQQQLHHQPPPPPSSVSFHLPVSSPHNILYPQSSNPYQNAPPTLNLIRNPHHHHPPPPPPQDYYSHHQQQQQHLQQPPPPPTSLLPHPPSIPPPPLHHHYHHHHHHLQHHQQNPYNIYTHPQSHPHNMPLSPQPPQQPPSNIQNILHQKHPSPHSHPSSQSTNPHQPISSQSYSTGSYHNFSQDPSYPSFDPASYYKTIPSEIYYSDMTTFSALHFAPNSNEKKPSPTDQSENIALIPQSQQAQLTQNEITNSNQTEIEVKTQTRTSTILQDNIEDFNFGNDNNDRHLSQPQSYTNIHTPTNQQTPDESNLILMRDKNENRIPPPTTTADEFDTTEQNKEKSDQNLPHTLVTSPERAGGAVSNTSPPASSNQCHNVIRQDSSSSSSTNPATAITIGVSSSVQPTTTTSKQPATIKNSANLTRDTGKIPNPSTTPVIHSANNPTPNTLSPSPSSTSPAPTTNPTPANRVMIPGHTTSQPVSQSTGLLDHEAREGTGCKDLREMLAQLGLSKYLEKFQEQDVDLQVFLSLTDNDLREVGIKLFGPRKKMANAIARWHSQAPLPNNCFEQAYADRLEGEMQELAIQLNQAYASEERLKAQVLQEQQLRSVTESCLMEVRGHWEKTRQTVEEAQGKIQTMGDALTKLRHGQKEIKKNLEEGRMKLEMSALSKPFGNGEEKEETQQSSSSIAAASREGLFVFSGLDGLVRKSEKYTKELHKGLSSLAHDADKVLTSTKDMSSLDKGLGEIENQ